MRSRGEAAKYAGRCLARALATIALAGLVGWALVRYSPGAGTDARQLDPVLSQTTRDNLTSAPTPSYWDYLSKAVHGDLGYSTALQAPVRELIVDRLPTTAKNAGVGLLLGWTLAAALALAGCWSKWAATLASTLRTFLLSMPLALLAALAFLGRVPVAAVVACGVFPKLHSFLTELLADSADRPHVLAAHVRGVGAWRVFWSHRVRAVAPEIASLLGVSATLALGAAIPAEVLCDSPGLGQLAWKAVMARDAAPLVALTWMMAAVAALASAFASPIGIAREVRSWRA